MTLVEVIISVGVVGVTFFSLYAGITYGFTVLLLARENLRATQIMMEKMETIRLYNWDQINSNGFIPATFVAAFNATNTSTNFGTGSGVLYYGTLTIAPVPATADDYWGAMHWERWGGIRWGYWGGRRWGYGDAMNEAYTNDMRLVTVTLCWTNNNQQRARAMCTLVSRYGLQNYIY